jgi:hypothetical protein
VLGRRIGAAVVSGSIVALLGVMPAGASASGGSVTPAYVSVSSGELGTLELDALGVESSQLVTLLADIPALGALPTGTLGGVIGALPANSTLQDLLSAVKLATGVEVTAGEATQVLLENPTADPAVLANVLSDVATLLHGSPQAPQLDEVLGNLIDGLTPEELQQLETALGVNGTPQELAASLAGKLADGELTNELATVVGELGPTTATTGSEVASSAGATPAALAGELGIAEGVLDTASGTSTPVGSLGGALAVLGHPDGLTLATVPSTLLGGAGGNGASGGNGATGSNGASGSNGSDTTSSTTTTSTTATGSTMVPATATKAAAKTAKVKIVSHKVKGSTLTLVVRVPAAGKLTVSAAHTKLVRKTAGKASTITLKIHLTRAGIADARRNHSLKVKVTAAFKAAGGVASLATTTAHFR